MVVHVTLSCTVTFKRWHMPEKGTHLYTRVKWQVRQLHVSILPKVTKVPDSCLVEFEPATLGLRLMCSTTEPGHHIVTCRFQVYLKSLFPRCDISIPIFQDHYIHNCYGQHEKSNISLIFIWLSFGQSCSIFDCINEWNTVQFTCSFVCQGC